MVQRLTYQKLIAWAVYMKVRARGPDPFVRDPDALQEWAANLYG